METEGRFYIKAAAAAAVGGRGGGYGGGGGGTKCGRWNPTAEQVKVLTELFRSGLRTPSTDQIQRISSQLSYYGKIESKNVFYWFQNHKARERQKRRKLVSHVSLVDDSSTTINNPSCTQPLSTKQHIGSRLKKQVVEASESCRVMETLELFPLNPFDELVLQETDKIRFRANDCSRDFSHAFGSDYHMDHPPLDLRLSFV